MAIEQPRSCGRATLANTVPVTSRSARAPVRSRGRERAASWNVSGSGFLAGALLLLAGAHLLAQQKPLRPPDVRFEPTPHEVVEQMLRLAGVRTGDVVYDLGCGDGRIVIAAARLGAKGVGIDIDPQRIGNRGRTRDSAASPTG